MDMQANQQILNAFLPHLDTAGMAESFVRLVGADEQVTLNAQPEALAWIAETDILSRLLERSAFFLHLWHGSLYTRITQ